MITEDKLAAAKVAQIFGSELLRVDTNTTQQASMTGPATRLNPKQFLGNTAPRISQNLREEERRILEAVQREAEASYPKEEPEPQYIAPPQQVAPRIPQVITHQLNQPVTPSITREESDQLTFADFFGTNKGGEPNDVVRYIEKISNNLERIANALEDLKVIPKKSKPSTTE
jgi:hypothetical protein